MQRDVYAIYESYILKEDGYDFSSSGTRQPGIPNNVKASANNTQVNPYNLGGAAPANNYTAGGGPVAGEQAEETREHKSLAREIAALNKLVREKKYEAVVMYCKTISDLANRAYNKEQEKKKKK
jgi:poly(3-hydroxybutyrate) depolymerase